MVPGGATTSACTLSTVDWHGADLGGLAGWDNPGLLCTKPATGGAKRGNKATGRGTSTVPGGSGRLLVAWAFTDLRLELYMTLRGSSEDPFHNFLAESIQGPGHCARCAGGFSGPSLPASAVGFFFPPTHTLIGIRTFISQKGVVVRLDLPFLAIVFVFVFVFL